MSDEIRHRIDEVLQEYLELDTLLREIQSERFRVCIFGSARIKPNDATYQLVLNLARKMAMQGIDIVTGGGPGLMEAANRGVQEAHSDVSKSYGVTIDLPSISETTNKHLDIKSSHKRFSSRLDEFMRLSHAVIVAPGGIGTLLELMYVWQLLQVGLINERPLVLLDREIWGGLIEWIVATMVERGFVSPEDMVHVQVVDTSDEALRIVMDAYRRFTEDLAKAGALGAKGPLHPLPARGIPVPAGAPPAPLPGRK